MRAEMAARRCAYNPYMSTSRSKSASSDSKDKEKDEAGNFRCLECGTLFISEALIESHIQKHHNPMNIYVCQRCKRSFKDNWHLKRHVIGHQMKDLSEKVYVCGVCKKVYKDPWMLQKHNSGGCCVQEITDEGENLTIEVIDSDGKDPPEQAKKPSPHYETEWFQISAVPTPFAKSTHPLPPVVPPALKDGLKAKPVVPRTASAPPPPTPPPVRKPQVAPPQPPSTDYFNCKLCGEVLMRTDFVPHLNDHIGDLYQMKEDQPRTLVYCEEFRMGRKKKVVEIQSCAKCEISAELVEMLKGTMGMLAQNSL